MHSSARVLAWLGASSLLALVGRAHADPGFTQHCDAALTRQHVDDLAARLRTVRGACRLERVDTSAFGTTIGWAAGSKHLLARLGPRRCVLEPSYEGPDLAFRAPDALGVACPAALAALREFTRQPRQLAPISNGWRAEPPSDRPPVALGSSRIVAGFAWLAALVLALGGIWRWWRAARERMPRRDDGLGASEPASEARAVVLVALATFVLALVARFSVEPTIGNWYGSFLPAEGWGQERFGSASEVLQAAARAVGPWTPATAFGLFRLVGASSVPLVVVLVRRLGASLTGAAVAGILLALAPTAVRLSASSSEHVIAGTLALAAWAVWMGTATVSSAWPRLLAVVLAWLTVMARVDCLPQLALIPVWTVLGARIGERGPVWLPLGRRLADALWFVVCLGAIAVHGWLEIVVPSHHPGPVPQAIYETLVVLLPQFWIAMIEPPHWVTPVTFALGLLGLGAAALHKRWRLLAAIAISLALVFLPLGRNLTHDGLTGARYFVLLFPLLSLVASAVFERDVLRVPQHRKLEASIVAVTIVGALAAWTAQPGWRHEYTFQAEYRFLSRSLMQHRAELDGCTLWFVEPRQGMGGADLDCCLSPAESPLTLLVPRVRFRPIPLERDPDDHQGCQLYYEGSICDVAPSSAGVSSTVLERIAAQCARLRGHVGRRALARRSITDVTLKPRFHRQPTVRLSVSAPARRATP